MVNEEVGQHLNNYYYYDTSWGHITNTIIQEIQPKVGGGLIEINFTFIQRVPDTLELKTGYAI